MANMRNWKFKRRNRRALLKSGACTGLAFIAATEFSGCSRQFSTKETELTDTDFSMVAYCCLECEKCDAYIATRNNDDILRAKVAKEWKMKAEDIHCDGCKSDNALFNCEAKKCAISKNLPTCAHCPEYPSCDKEIWTKWPILKNKVEAMRAKLQI